MFITNNGSKQFMDDASKQQLDNDAQSLAEPSASPNGKAIASTSISHDGEQELIVGQQQLVIDDQLSLLNLSPDILVIANKEGYFTYANPACEKLLGFSPAELTAQPYLNFVHPDDVASTVAVAQDLSQGIELVGFENRYLTKAGSYRWFSWNVTTLPARNQFYAIGRDITDRKQADAKKEQLLLREQNAREEAERANRIKDDFLAVVSHELRSPLSPILGWSQLLQTSAFTPEKTQMALATIEANAKLQVQLIDDLLDVSRILRKKMSLEAAPVALNQIIAAATETVRLTAEAKSMQIRTVVPDDMLTVMGDAGRLQQILLNLLANAIKFTPEAGQVTVTLAVIEQTYAQIQVIDTGKGIAADFLPHIFEHFRQGDESTTRRSGGLGLGLAIAQQLVEMHSGTLSVQSPGEGRGATFTVKIPLATFDESPTGAPPASPGGDLSGVHVLIVDDETDSREITTCVLEQANATVTIAWSGAEALTVLQQLSPDVLISDIGMPEMDGYTLMRQIRSLPPEQGGQVIAIALTAYVNETDQQKAINAGFQHHVGKPIDPNDLVALIISEIAGEQPDSSQG